MIHLVKETSRKGHRKLEHILTQFHGQAKEEKGKKRVRADGSRETGGFFGLLCIRESERGAG